MKLMPPPPAKNYLYRKNEQGISDLLYKFWWHLPVESDRKMLLMKSYKKILQVKKKFKTRFEGLIANLVGRYRLDTVNGALTENVKITRKKLIIDSQRLGQQIWDNTDTLVKLIKHRERTKDMKDDDFN